MNISLTPKLEELVKQKVETGLYNSASEVIREALRLLSERDHEKAEKLERLRASLAVGEAQLDRGEYSTKTVEEIVKEAKQKRHGKQKV